jgi:hypothetical protein
MSAAPASAPQTPHAAPAPTVTAPAAMLRCRNCEAPLVGPFCAECGQKHHEHLDPSIREIAHEAGEELLHLDGKLLETMRLLLTAPGRLTREFLAGRRARYLSPLKLYLTCSVLYFFIMALVPARGDLGIGTMTVSERTPTGTVRRPMTDQERDSVTRMLARKAEQVGGVQGAALRGFTIAETQPDLVRHEMVQAMPKIMFVLVPFFALVAGMVYRRRRLHYPTHLIFALHVFAFYFAVSAVARLTRLAGAPALSELAGIAVLLATVAYLWVAMRRMYGGRVWTTALRIATLITVFGLGFLTVITTSAVAILGWR